MAKGASNPNSRQNRHVPKEGGKKKEKKEEEVKTGGFWGKLMTFILSLCAVLFIFIDADRFQLIFNPSTSRLAECLPPSETENGFHPRDFRPCNLSAEHNLELLNEYRSQFEKGMFVPTEGKDFKARPSKEEVPDSIRGLVDFQLSLALRSHDDKLRDLMFRFLSDAHSYVHCVQTDSIDKSTFPRSFCERVKTIQQLPNKADRPSSNFIRAAHMTSQVFAWIGGEFHDAALSSAGKYMELEDSLYHKIKDYMVEVNDYEKINQPKLLNLLFSTRYREQIKKTFEEIMRRLEIMSECSPRHGISWIGYMHNVPDSIDSDQVKCYWINNDSYSIRSFLAFLRYVNGRSPLRLIKSVILSICATSVAFPPFTNLKERHTLTYFLLNALLILAIYNDVMGPLLDWLAQQHRSLIRASAN